MTAALRDVSLSDRLDLAKSPVLLNGTQALVRLTLMQAARDRTAGLDTAGCVTGYRGSPLGAVDMQMQRAAGPLRGAGVRFAPALNEDLAVTALWGTQQAALRGEGRHAGVFGLWYGKGPGVDRSGDAMRHANMAGTAPLGGVLMAMGDDHTGESSTTLHQSDWAMRDAWMPVLSPAGVEEIMSMGLYGWALSRFAGLWVGLKTMKDTVEATAVARADPFDPDIRTPGIALPEGGLGIRLQDTPQAQEARMVEHKIPAARAFAATNGIDGAGWRPPGARIGLVAAGKNWLDVVHALSLLGIDEGEAGRLGLATYKVGQVWPLETEGLKAWAEGLDLILCVEEKRGLIEGQVKDALFHGPRRRVWGAFREDEGGRRPLFPRTMALDPVAVADAVGGILIEEGRRTDRIEAALARIGEARAEAAPDLAARLPYFCSGCPHNTSTKVPDGARAYAGIGCHYMVQWMDRETTGFTQMGGEGANWIGEAPFSTRGHVFQNMGDGTYNHSGVQAIRAAVAAGTTMTFKILYNDAVAMTGGQGNDGGLDAHRIAAELAGIGLRRIAMVHDPKEGFDPKGLPAGVEVRTRDALDAVQREMAATEGVTAILYVQTCAAEKRRRRKRGAFPPPAERVLINPEVCEGCGDCGVQSNCVSLVPVETPFGRKRAVDQSSCNFDASCVNGFCPSFVTVRGGVPPAAAARRIETGPLPVPDLPGIDGTHATVITGIGGTGVVTVGAVLSMAAHLEGLGAGMIEMAGLAQKGGAVHIHLRIAEKPCDISAIRVALGEADAVIGGDLVTTAGAATLSLTAPGRTGAVVNLAETITGDFTRDTGFALPAAALRGRLEERLGKGVHALDASALARAALGDAIFANMIMVGAAWQRGLVPLSEAAILRAVELNGAAVDGNREAFRLGRWAVVRPEAAAARAAPGAPALPRTDEERIAAWEGRVRDHSGEAGVARFRRALDRAPAFLRPAMAEGFGKLLTYKDEYEVARLHMDTRRRVAEAFGEGARATYHLAPPMLPGRDGQGRPRKRRFGAWMDRVWPLLARMRRLRGTPFDPFGRTADRRLERALISRYEADLEVVLPLADANPGAALAWARLPLSIRGYGPVKLAAAEAAALRRAELLDALRAGPVRQAAE